MKQVGSCNLYPGIKSHNKRRCIAVAVLLALSGTAAFMPADAQTYINYDGSKTTDLNAALTSWTSAPEFAYKSGSSLQGDWGLAAMNTQHAYVRGYSGAGVKLGAVDSGLRVSHEEFAQRGNVTPITISGTYLNAGEQKDGGGLTWKAGDTFNTPGTFNSTANLAAHLGANDLHGSHVSGSIAAAKNGLDDSGQGMMGVAWGSDYYITNSNGTDSSVYGENLDYNYFYQAYDQLARAGARVINSSWGSPRYVDDFSTVSGLIDAYRGLESIDETGNSTKKSWIDAAADVSRKTGVLQVFAAGNTMMANPNVRSAVPYFEQDVEKYWLTVAALDENLSKSWFSNSCGVAKYWCVSAPGSQINSIDVTSDSAYISEMGTSMAAPHVTGALGVLMQRYPTLDNEAIRTILLTTATHLGQDGPSDVPDATYGWGIPNLQKAMDGPGQFLGVFNANYTTGTSDTWSNSISEAALIQRKKEEKEEIAAWPKTKAGLTAAQAIEAQKRIDALKAKTDADYVGSLVKTGDGSLTLTGDNSYSGGTQLQGGTLGVGSATALGAGALTISGGATLQAAADGLTLANPVTVSGPSKIDTQTRTLGLSGAIAGTGGLTKVGDGILNLTGKSTFTGATTVAAGTLIVDGTLPGSITSQSGSLLAGTGTVGTTRIGSGSTLAPGNASTPLGTLNVNGDLAFDQGAALQIRSDEAGNASAVHATGGAKLGGSVLNIAHDGLYETTTRYDILTADKGVSGQFDTVSTNLAYLLPSLEYGANTVDLVMKKKLQNFADLAVTPNQVATADALQSMPSDSALYKRTLNLTEAAPPGVFNSMSGEAYATTVGTLQGIGSRVSDLPLSHLQAKFSSDISPEQFPAQSDQGDGLSSSISTDQQLWAQVFGNTIKRSGGSGTSSSSISDGGLFAGGDGAIGADWRLGGALGYTGTRAKVNDLNSSAKIDSYSAVLYGGKAFDTSGPGKINVSLGGAYTWHDIEARRAVNAAGSVENLQADYKASTAQVFGEFGYAMPVNDRYTIEPYVRGSYSDLRTRAFQESGGDAALSGDSGHNQVASTTLGLHNTYAFKSAGKTGRVQASVGWRHAYGDVNPETTLAFQGSQSFTVTGAPIARNSAVVELGVDMDVSNRTTVGLKYSGEFGSGMRRNAGILNVRYRF